MALLELLHATVPFVTPVAILVQSLPVTLRILRALLFVTTTTAEDALVVAAAALVRDVSRRDAAFAALVNNNNNTEKATQQLLRGTLLALLPDPRPKVRQLAQNGLLEGLQPADNNCKCSRYYDCCCS